MWKQWFQADEKKEIKKYFPWKTENIVIIAMKYMHIDQISALNIPEWVDKPLNQKKKNEKPLNLHLKNQRIK